MITRRGKPVARLSRAEQPKRPIDWEAIDRIRESMPFQEVSSVEILRQMRDEEY